ncbi:MAG: CaiB/BaiF CoA transferase family protein [Myxococcota bacterium]
MTYPLESLRVLDLSRVLAGPYVGRLLADLGADVVKLEPPEGDITRLWGRIRHGLSGYYTQQNVGKRNVCLDLHAPGASDLALRLAAAADVVIENFRPGVLERLGLGWSRLSAANPGLVLLSISGFGQTGPGATRAAYAPIVHGESGLVARQAAFDERSPSDPVLSIADTNAGLHGLVGVLSSLLLRARTGRGQHVDIAMLDALFSADDYAHFTLDGVPIQRGGGSVWEATGGPVMLSGDFRWIWRQLVKVHGVTDPTPTGAPLADKIRLRRQAARDFFCSFPDRASLLRALEACGIAWGDVLTPEAAFRQPAPLARGVTVEVDDRAGGTRTVVRSPYRFSGAESGVRRGAAYRGEHNSEVLEDWLAMTPDQIETLRDADILQAEDPAA